MGYLSADDEQARENVVNTMDALNISDGIFYSEPAGYYRILAAILGFEKGVVTGMTYGYFLDNLARIDHPQAEETFLGFRKFFHDTGNVSEVMVVDDFGRFTYLQEPFGFVCDLTARYRSWEGGINGAAMVRYLFGLDLFADENRIAIAPHLPADWDFAAMENGRVGDVGFDIVVEDDGSVRCVKVENLTGPITVDAVVSVGGGISEVSVNGATVVPSETIERWGRTRAVLPGLVADAGDPLVIEVTRQ